jgi:hypothetical protein
MNAHSLLIAYAEEQVKPVVSDFDALMVGSTGMEYVRVPDDQLELAKWSLAHTEQILESPSPASWTERWLEVLHDLAEQGEHHEFPEFGYGDVTSIALVQEITKTLQHCGAIRHGAECFNYHFPQELDEEFMIVWEHFEGKPWRYDTECDLRKFLLARADEGYVFPVNPVWPVRDVGWHDVLQALRANPESQPSLAAWFPPESGLLAQIDLLHERYPAGFTPVQYGRRPRQSICSTLRDDAELILHGVMMKANSRRKALQEIRRKIQWRLMVQAPHPRMLPILRTLAIVELLCWAKLSKDWHGVDHQWIPATLV